VIKQHGHHATPEVPTLKPLSYGKLISIHQWETFDIAHDLTMQGITEFLKDYSSVQKRSAQRESRRRTRPGANKPFKSQRSDSECNGASMEGWIKADQFTYIELWHNRNFDKLARWSWTNPRNQNWFP